MSTIDYATFNTLKDRMKTKFPILLSGYIKDAKSYLETVRNSLTSGDIQSIIEATHSLKSASGLLGIIAVHKAAETLEYAGKDLQETGESAIESLKPHCEALQNAFFAVEADLQTELDKATA